MCVSQSPVARVAALLVYDAGLPYLGEFFQALSNPEEAVLGHYFFSWLPDLRKSSSKSWTIYICYIFSPFQSLVALLYFPH